MPRGDFHPIRMLDIAREAGVSRPVVSAVLSSSGHGSIRVSEETASRIRAIAAKHHFQPNSSAQMLAGKQSRIIGVLVDTFAGSHVFEILSSLEGHLAQAGYSMLVAQTHDNREVFQRNLSTFAMYKTAGIVAMAHGYPLQDFDLYDELAGLPHVLLLGRPLREGVSLPYVEKDIEGGVELGVRELAASGCRKIAITVGEKAFYDIPMAGYRRGLAACGMALEEGLALNSQQVNEDGEDLLLASRADALITNELTALRLLSVFYERGIRIPDRLSLLSLDSSRMSVHAAPALSCIDFSNEHQAECLFHHLMELIETGKTDNELLEPAFIRRKTTV